MPMNVNDRLRRLGIASAASPRPARPPRPQSVPGEVVSGPEGECVVREVRCGADWRHGDQRLDAVLPGPADLAALAGREPSYATVPVSRRAYLDTETTSLNSGAGVMVFLFGIGFFEGPDFVVRQFFMRHPAEERAVLREVARLLSRFDALITFHGKSFDCPRARDRYLFQDLEDGLPGPTHLDLCPAARRLFGHRFSDCRLQTLERGLMGFVREDDLPGAECPTAWFRYQRGEENRIARVMEHNFFDIVSLAVLEARVARAFVTPDDLAESLVAGTLAWEQGQTILARERLLSGVDALTGRGDPWTAELRRRLDAERFATRLPGLPASLRAARALRKLGETDAAAALLAELMRACPDDPRPVHAMAILEERDRRSPAAALRVVESALTRPGAHLPDSNDLLTRLARLRDRTRRASPEAPAAVPLSEPG